MIDPLALTDLLARLRRGDETAATDLVSRYGPALRRHFDSEDVCQSVLASFFARAACGQLAPDDPAGLLRLLVRMAVRKVGRRARNLRRLRRDHRRDTAGGEAWLSVPASSPSPDRVVSGRELLTAVRAGLGADDRRLADLRAEGMSWVEVAGRTGGTPEARRKQLRRALDEVLVSLGVEDVP
jgi:DNA-directed RNA polymerase specialized sigma24 family protein